MSVKFFPITKSEMEAAYKEKLEFYGYLENNNLKTLRYFQDAAMDELDTLNIPNSLLDTGGLKVYTTLDMNTQTILEESINSFSTYWR